MKKILITGQGSYIGESFKNYVLNNYTDYTIETVDMLTDKWKETDFSGYDAVFHVAGIAHIKETKENASLYYKVNCDLAYEVANKAKNEITCFFINIHPLYSLNYINMERILEQKKEVN